MAAPLEWPPAANDPPLPRRESSIPSQKAPPPPLFFRSSRSLLPAIHIHAMQIRGGQYDAKVWPDLDRGDGADGTRADARTAADGRADGSRTLSCHSRQQRSVWNVNKRETTAMGLRGALMAEGARGQSSSGRRGAGGTGAHRAGACWRTLAARRWRSSGSPAAASSRGSGGAG